MKRGFTLIELLVVMAIMIIMATAGLFSLSSYRRQQTLRLAGQSVVGFLNDVRQRAISGEGGTQWGTHFDYTGTRGYYRLFSGPSYTAAVNSVPLPVVVEFQDPSTGTAKDVVFSKITGWPVAPTTVIIGLIGDPASIRTITINAQGVITEQ